jgi:hypothetical protein
VSEYIEVEQAFLVQLAAKDWAVFGQGTQLLQHAVPSWRGSFRSLWLPGVFREAEFQERIRSRRRSSER